MHYYTKTDLKNMVISLQNEKIEQLSQKSELEADVEAISELLQIVYKRLLVLEKPNALSMPAHGLGIDHE